MTVIELLFGLIELALWYAFFWAGLDAIKHRRNTWVAALWLVVLGCLAFVACPWVRDTRAWERLF